MGDLIASSSPSLVGGPTKLGISPRRKREQAVTEERRESCVEPTSSSRFAGRRLESAAWGLFSLVDMIRSSQAAVRRGSANGRLLFACCCL